MARRLKKPRVVTQESIEEARKMSDYGTRRFDYKILTPLQLIKKRDRIAPKNMISGKIMHPVELSKIITASLTESHFDLKKRIKSDINVTALAKSLKSF